MQRFEPLTKSDCEQLRQEVTELLMPLAEKYGICLDSVKKACSRDADSVTINTRFSLPQRPESVATLKEELDFRCYAEGFGMQPAWLARNSNGATSPTRSPA